MEKQDNALDIYLMGIGGTGMGAFAGLLKSQGHRVRGSDNAVYSPMREKLTDWGISYQTPYQPENLAPRPDLVIVGNVIRKDNPEAVFMREQDLAHESFPQALNRLFLGKACSIVASGTHGKTTCSALLAHVLYHADRDPGFLIGGIPQNFGESFRASKKAQYPFVVEGDEYDTAYFDKSPKFMHYRPDILLLTSVEFDHADIYQDLDAVIGAFARLLATMPEHSAVVISHEDQNIREAIKRSGCKAKILSYGPLGDWQAHKEFFSPAGISFSVLRDGQDQGEITLPLFGQHNLANGLGCYAVLRQFGLSHDEIKLGFASFLGVKRRLEVRYEHNDITIIDDFAHHPTAVKETIKAARQKYPTKKLWAIFEPRSATSCTKVFENAYIEALHDADRVIFAPVGRNLAAPLKLDTAKMAQVLIERGISASAYDSYEQFKREFCQVTPNSVLLFMSNGDLGGHMQNVENLLV